MTSLNAVPPHGRALVSLGGGRHEVRTFPISTESCDTGWLKVAASGVCGTDVGLHSGTMPAPTVLGHHVVGEVVAAGPQAPWLRNGVTTGSRVVVEEYLPCGQCSMCRSGRYRLCPETDLWTGGRRIGTVPIDEAPSLWGGNAEYLHLPPNAVLHPIPAQLAWDDAVWALPFANALDWLTEAGGLKAGQSVMVIGPGYHGLCAVAAARTAGASGVFISGLASDAARLDLARKLGAEVLPGVEAELGAEVRNRTDGRGVDVVLDTTGAAGVRVATSQQLLAPGGHLVFATPKGDVVLDSREMTRRMQNVHAVRGRSPGWVRRGIDILAAGNTALTTIPSVRLKLAEAGSALTDLGNGAGSDSPHVVVHPGVG